jgi:hypothetical protein
MCVDITGAGVYPNSLIRIALYALYGGTKVFGKRIEMFPYPNVPSSISFWWGQLIGNWGTGNIRDFKGRFEGSIPPVTGISAPLPWYPCHLSGDVFGCDSSYAPFQSAVSTKVNADAAYQKGLYCTVIGDFSNASQDGVAVQAAATQLAGTKAALEKYLLIGAPHSLSTNDYLRALVYGKSALPGRADNGQDDVVTYIYGPAVMALTGAPTFTQACGTGVTTNQTSPKLDLNAVLSPRLTNMQAALTDMLGRIDQNQISEYDDTLNFTLQSLQTFLDAKVANTVATSAGSNVTVNSPQNIQVTFPTVLQSGVTVTTATEPGAASGVPGGFVINGSALTTVLAYDVETTSTYVGPVTTCFTVNSVNDSTAFSGLAVLLESGAFDSLKGHRSPC